MRRKKFIDLISSEQSFVVDYSSSIVHYPLNTGNIDFMFLVSLAIRKICRQSDKETDRHR